MLVSTAIGLGISGVAAAASVAGSTAGIANSVRSGNEKVPGATSGQMISEQASRTTSDRLAMQGGLSETEYGRMIEQVRQSSASIGAEATQIARNTFNVPSIALDKLVRGSFRQSGQMMTRGQEAISSADINQARVNLKDSIQAEQVAGTRSDIVANAEYRKVIQEQENKNKARINLSKILGDVGSAIYGTVDSMGDLITQAKVENIAKAKAQSDEYDVHIFDDEFDAYGDNLE